MINFVTPLDARALPCGNHWVLLNDFIVDIGELDGKNTVVLPRGFVTDFGSVPQFFWRIVNPQGIAKPAYVLHDWLYNTQEEDQLVADGKLHEGMQCLGVGWFQRWAVYRGLRLGGFLAWNEHSRERLAAAKAGKPYPRLVDIVLNPNGGAFYAPKNGVLCDFGCK